MLIFLFTATSCNHNPESGKSDSPASFDDSELFQSLSKIEDIVSVERLNNDTNSDYLARYLINVKQPLDWNNPADKRTFTQRVVIKFAGADHINVLDINGYALADFQTNFAYPVDMDRITMDFTTYSKGNCISPEYRFFGTSIPDGLDNTKTDLWEFLTTENASKDFHHIIEILKPVFGDNWACTGASKGGYSTNAFAYFFPEDCSIYVSYVAPLCDGLEDKRYMEKIYTSIGDEKFGTEKAAEYRKALLDIQVDLIKYRDEFQSTLYEKAIKDGCKFTPYATKERIYDMAVIEYAVSTWQYDFIPQLEQILAVKKTETEDNYKESLFDMFSSIISFSSWSYNFWAFPYYIQTALEMGGYHYDFSYLKKAIEDNNIEQRVTITPEEEDGILLNLILQPEQVAAFKYNKTLRDNLINWSNTTKSTVIMVYGSFDVWYSVRIPDTDNPNVHIFVDKETGSHRPTIKNMTEEMKQAIADIYKESQEAYKRKKENNN